jgi:small-conductance mechanosensitive channel
MNLDFSFEEIFGSFRITQELLSKIIKIAIVAVVVYLLARLILYIVKKALLKRMSKHESQLISKVVYYSILIFGVFIILNILEVKLSGILATAGVLTIAISFAAQTTFSNLISGIFLYFDRPFEVGDSIEVEGKGGVVLSIGILSTKLRTFDNLFYRVPNSILIEKPLINYTRFDIRRLEIVVGVSYDTDIKRVKEVLTDVFKNNNSVLNSPPASIYLDDFASSSVNLMIRCWFTSDEYFDAASDLKIDIKNAFDKNNIDIPFEKLVVKLEDNPEKL